MNTIDKIRAEIERRMETCDATSKTPNQLLWAELSALLLFLDSLSKEDALPCWKKVHTYTEELHEGDMEKMLLDLSIGKGKRETKIALPDKVVDSISEEPVSDDLEEELDRFIASGKSVTVDDYGTYKVSYHDFKKVARHFAEWGENNAYKAIMKKADEVRGKRFDVDYEVKIEPAAGSDWGCINVYREGKLVGQYVEPKEENKLPEDVEEAADDHIRKVAYAAGHPGWDWETQDIADAFKAGAEWQEKRWENNRLMAQDKATEEECQREMDFVDNHIKKHHRIPTFSDAINYGIEWQKKQMPLPEDTLIFRKGVEEGRRLMMEDAVEGEVIKTNKHTSVRYKSYYGTDRYFYGIADKQFKPGDKVRIIIVKEDGE